MRVEILKINSEEPELSLIRYAADQIRAGEVLGMPTDTFYGLAADPFNLRAVERVYEIKSRSRHKPLSLLIGDVEQAEELAKPLPEEFHALAKKFWPGPLTIIVKAASRLPLKVTANTGNVALRVPNAAIPIAVVTAAGIPITATSANLSGETECTSAEEVREQLGVLIPIIVDGGSFSARDCLDHSRSHRRRSTLEDFARRSHLLPGDFRVLREGVIATASKRAILWTAVVAVFVVATAVASIVHNIIHDSRQQELRPADAIVVFGAAEYVGHPSPVFRARLDHALDLFRQGLAPVDHHHRWGCRRSQIQRGRSWTRVPDS